MKKEVLQNALDLEEALMTSYDILLGDDELGWTQHNSLKWHSEQRIRAIRKAADFHDIILDS